MPEINFKEWKFVGLLSIVVIIITFLPTLVGLIVTPEDSVFLGTQHINVEDTPIYYSWIEQAKEGHLLFKNLYTTEDQIRYIFDPFWLGVGLFAKMFSLSAFAVYQLARIFLIPIFLAIAYIFISYFLEEEKKRKLCFIFLIFTSGFGGFVALGSLLGLFNFSPPPMDLWVAEATTFYALYHSPHFLASITLTLLIFLLILLSFEKRKIIYSLLAGLSALLFFQFRPYHIPTIYGVLAVFIIIQSIRTSKIRWDLIKHYLLLILVSSPAIIYHLWTLNTFWSRQQFALQNNLLTPSFYNFTITYGLLFLLSFFGILFLLQKKQKNNKDIFLLTWWGAQIILPYLPIINYQRKMMEGLHVIMVIMTILGLFYLQDVFKNRDFLKNKSLLAVLFMLFFTFSNYFIITLDLSFYLNPSPRAFLKQNETSAMLWLKKNTLEESIIFATYRTGNLIPAFAVRTVYLGSWGNTAASRTKQEQTKQFFEVYPDKARAAFLELNNIDYLFFGPEEKAAANFDPNTADYLEKTYQNDEVEIYKVKKD
ncbi:hypothetical protein KKD80_00715 [Patescibacteria group bacterium]|nr:hypothetical protein [Patescibacteria group bacterium]